MYFTFYIINIPLIYVFRVMGRTMLCILEITTQYGLFHIIQELYSFKITGFY